jgi:hypothetical protein
MATQRWLFLGPVLWLAFVYVMHSSKNPVQAVVGWALIFAPMYLVVCVAEVYARIYEWRTYRNFEKRK